MRIKSHEILNITGLEASSTTSETIQLEHGNGCSIEITYDSTNVFQETIITVQTTHNEVTWTDMADVTLCEYVAGKSMINITDVMYKAIRLVFLNTAGPVNIIATVYSKGF